MLWITDLKGDGEDASSKQITVSYTDINRIECMESMVPGKRIFGYGSFPLMMGGFENEVFGAYTRYSFSGCVACVAWIILGNLSCRK